MLDFDGYLRLLGDVSVGIYPADERVFALNIKRQRAFMDLNRRDSQDLLEFVAFAASPTRL